MSSSSSLSWKESLLDRSLSTTTVFPGWAIFISRVIVSRAIIKNILGKGGGGHEAEVHSFQSPSEYSFETRNDGQHRRDKLAGRRLAYSTMTHNERISTLVHQDFLLKGPPLPDASVCTGRLINIGRIGVRAEESKEFLWQGATRTFLSPIGRNIETVPLELLLIEWTKKSFFSIDFNVQ